MPSVDTRLPIRLDPARRLARSIAGPGLILARHRRVAAAVSAVYAGLFAWVTNQVTKPIVRPVWIPFRNAPRALDGFATAFWLLLAAAVYYTLCQVTAARDAELREQAERAAKEAAEAAAVAARHAHDEDLRRERIDAQQRLESQLADARAVHTAEMHKLDRQIADYDERRRALPPTGMLARWADLHVGVHDALRAALFAYKDVALAGDNRNEVLIHWSRIVLFAIATLAREFDGEQRTQTVGVNVMRLVRFEADGPLPPPHAALLRRCVFMDRARPDAHWGGVLELLPALSATSARPGRDEAMPELVLPVPRRARDADDILTVLPGAPESVLFGIQAYDVPALLTECESKRRLGDGVAAEVRTYFEGGAGTGLQSLVSLPLRSGIDNHAVGVLNIHSDRPCLCAHPERRRHLELLLTPGILTLIDLLQWRNLITPPAGSA